MDLSNQEVKRLKENDKNERMPQGDSFNLLKICGSIASKLGICNR